MVIGFFKKLCLMKKRIVFLFLFIINTYGFAQVIKIKSGVSITNLRAQNFPILDKSVYVFDASLGLEYLENNRFFLNTEIGYSQKGGKEKNPLIQGQYNDFNKKWNTLYFITTFRYKIPVNDLFIYVGAGPQINYLIDNKNDFDNTPYAGSEYILEKINLGISPEIGLTKDSTKFRYSIGFSYLVGLSKFGSTDFNKLYTNSLNIGISLGYKL